MARAGSGEGHGEQFGGAGGGCCRVVAVDAPSFNPNAGFPSGWVSGVGRAGGGDRCGNDGGTAPAFTAIGWMPGQQPQTLRAHEASAMLG